VLIAYVLTAERVKRWFYRDLRQARVQTPAQPD
jgi:hypothetical protein